MNSFLQTTTASNVPVIIQDMKYYILAISPGNIYLTFSLMEAEAMYSLINQLVWFLSSLTVSLVFTDLHQSNSYDKNGMCM